MKDLIGRRFAYRARPHTAGETLRPALVVREGPPRSLTVRVRWLDGEYEGLEEWVPRVRLVVPWAEAEGFLQDEGKTLAAVEASGDVHGSLEHGAAELVFMALPSGLAVGFGYRGLEQDLLVIDDFAVQAPGLGLRCEDLLAEPLAFVDRFGRYVAPFQVAVRVARHCCRSFAQPPLLRRRRGEEAGPGGGDGLHRVGPDRRSTHRRPGPNRPVDAGARVPLRPRQGVVR